MASYCAAEDVSVLLGLDSYSSTTRPTLTQVNTIIADVTNEIDFVLSGVGITTQPTDTRVLGRLGIACKYGVAAQCALSSYGNADGVEGSQGGKYLEQYNKILDEIREFPGLYGAVTGDSQTTLSSPVLDGTYTESEITDGFMDRDYEP